MEPIYSTADIARRLQISESQANRVCLSALRNIKPRKRRKLSQDEWNAVIEWHEKFGRKRELKNKCAVNA